MQPSSHFSALVLSALTALTLLPSVHAQAVYAGAGFLGRQIGYAHAVNDDFTVRADYLDAGTYNQSSTESGTRYDGSLKFSRAGLFADWFPGQTSGFRITAGLTHNDLLFSMTAQGAGKTVDINNQTYVLGAGDSFNVRVTMPRTTPYLGVGYGHRNNKRGWGLHADLGFSFGRYTVSETRTGALAAIAQSEVDAETQQIRSSLAKLGYWPQLTVGALYRF